MKKLLAITGAFMALAVSANAAIVINEMLYDLAGTDAGEFIELYNNGGAPVDISGYTIELVNGSSVTVYDTITIPAATTLNNGEYYVIGNAATIDAVFGVGTVDLDDNLNNGIQNGAPDAMALYDGPSVSGTLLDSLAYEADGAAGASPLGDGFAEGGTGRTVAGLISDSFLASTSRLPNGVDTDSNALDFANTLATPGAANADSITLPLTSDFTTIPAGIIGGFVQPRSVDGLATVGVASSNGGNVMEVVDNTGGGDTAYIGGAFSVINVEGEIYLPPAQVDVWSTGVGIFTRSESTWFSGFSGNGLENGFYLEYQNGPGTGLKAIADVASTPEARFVAVSSLPTLNSGSVAGATANVLGTTSAVNLGGWNSFRVFGNAGANTLFASINGTVIYSGAFPTDQTYNTSGGVVFGFRETPIASPLPTGVGTFIDGLVVNTNTTADVSDWTMYDN